MIFITYSVLNLFAQHAIACVLCELLCLELFNVFSNTIIGSVTSFSILFNFQGPVRLRSFNRRLDYFITEAIFCQALFSEAFRFLRTCDLTFQRSHIGSSLSLPPLSRSHSFRRPLALEYNTTSFRFWQVLFSSFSLFFACLAFSPVFYLNFPLLLAWIQQLQQKSRPCQNAANGLPCIDNRNEERYHETIRCLFLLLI